MVGVFYDSLYLHFHICVMYLYIDLGFLWFSFPHVLFVFPRLCLYHICMWRLFTSYILWRAMIGSITHTFSLYWLSDYPKHISFPNFMSFYVIIFRFFWGLNTFWICWWNFTWETKEPLIPKFGHGNFQFGSLLNIFRNIPLEKLFVLSASPPPII